MADNNDINLALETGEPMAESMQPETAPTPIPATPDDSEKKEPETEKGDNVSDAASGSPERKENTRSMMAILFVLGFFSILFLCFVYAIKVNAPLGDLKDTLVGVIGALSGILGFIVGYYYKSQSEQ